MNVKEPTEETKTPKILTFVHRFSPTVTATIQVMDQPPVPDKNGLLPFRHDIHWSERPHYSTAKEYRKWILSVNRTLSDRWKILILYGLLLKEDEMELWRFEPGKKPRLESKLKMTG